MESGMANKNAKQDISMFIEESTKKTKRNKDKQAQQTTCSYPLINRSTRVLGLSAGTGKHCDFGHLELVFIWSCFVFCILLLRNFCSGTCRSSQSF